MKKGKKHRLLIYDHFHRRGRRLVFLLAIAMLVLYALPSVVDAETLKLLWAAEYDNLLLFASLAFFFVFMAKLIAPRLPYIQCTERNVRIRLPFYVFVMSYRRITTTRPNQLGQIFPHKKLTRAQRGLIGDILGAEIIILDMKGWPVPLGWLKFMGLFDVMFLPGDDGLILWVDDWMALNRELTDFGDRWRQARSESKPAVSVYSQMRDQ